MSTKIELRYIEPGMPEYASAKEIRYQALYGEWGLPRHLVEDTDGHTYRHLVAMSEGQVVGYVRIRLEDEDGKILQLTVDEKSRGRGIAKILMREVMDLAKREGFTEVYLDAREHVIGFYDGLGFVGEGEIFLSPRTGTPHRVMRYRFDG